MPRVAARSAAGVAAAAAVVVGVAVVRDQPGAGPSEPPATRAGAASAPAETSPPPAPARTAQPSASARARRAEPSPPARHSAPADLRVDEARSEPAPAPGTTPTHRDPKDAALAYLLAAETVGAADGRQRHHRAEAHLAPGNPERGRGLATYDPPPPETARTVKVFEVSQWARNRDRVAYKISYVREEARRGQPARPAGGRRVTYVIVQRQADGRWLTLRHAAQLDVYVP